MVDPVKVWVASFNDEPLYIDVHSEQNSWDDVIARINLPRVVLETLGWTVRPMTLLDGHGEQNAEPNYVTNDGAFVHMKPLPQEFTAAIHYDVESLYNNDPLPDVKDTKP